MSTHPRAWASALAVTLTAACGGDSTAPPPGVTRLELSAEAVTMELGRSVQLHATPRDAMGASVAASVTWSSSDPAVVAVNGTGLITALAAGSSTVTATAQGVRATVPVEVLPFRADDAVVAVDSTEWSLVSDSAELAGGRYHFRRLSGSGATPFGIGSVIVGAQRGGFLRRVTSVDVVEDDVEMETDQALLEDLIAEGEFGFRGSLFDGSIGLSGNPPLVRLRTGELVRPRIRLGPIYVRSSSEAVRVGARTALAQGSLLDLQDFDLCAFLKKAGVGDCPGYVDEFKLATLSIDFDPDFDFGTTWNEDGDLTEFHGSASGQLRTKAEVAVGLKFAQTFKKEVTLLEVGRIVYIQLGAIPVVVHVEAEMKATFEATATVKGKLQGGLETDHTAEVGASWDDKQGWQATLTGTGQFTPIQPSVDDSTAFAGITLEANVTLTPDLNLKFYGIAGPLVGLGPYAHAKLTADTRDCGFDLSAGLEGKIGIALADFVSKALKNPDYSKKDTLATLPGKTWTCPVGNLEVIASTSGSNPDPDGYSITVDGNDYGALANNGSQDFFNLRLGVRSVALAGVANNCQVKGQNPRDITVTPSGTTTNFVVECVDTTGVGNLTVAVATSGPVPDPDGYTATVNGSQTVELPTNGAATLAGIAAGQVQVALSGLADNCTVMGPNPQSATLGNAQNLTLSFSVECTGGTLEVTTTTTGPFLPGYEMSLAVDDGQSAAIGSDETVSLTVIDGDRTVELQGLPGQCVTSSANPASVSVANGGVGKVTFQLDCPPGDLVVNVATNGDSTVTSYTVLLDGANARTVDAQGGSTTYSDVATGSHTLELQGTPGECTVLDDNPRSVTAPGTTQFTVDCGSGGGGDILIVDRAGLWTMRTDGTSPLLILPNQPGVLGPAFAAWKDASTIVVVGPGTWTVADDGTGLVKRSETGAYYVSLAPDGVKASHIDATEQLYVLSLTGGDPKPLFARRDSLVAFHSDWVPSGGEILFAGYREGSGPGQSLYKVSATRDTVSGPAPTPFAVPGTDLRSPRYSPDGTELAYTSRDDGELRVVPATGGSATTVAAYDFNCTCNTAWSPDGTALVFGGTVAGITGVYRVNRDGSDLTLLRAVSGSLVWVDWR